MQLSLFSGGSMLKAIDNFESIIWTDRYNDYGDFELQLTADENTLSVFTLDSYIRTSISEHVMIIEEREKTSNRDGSKITLRGRSFESVLDRRIIYGGVGSEGTSTAHTVRTPIIINSSFQEGIHTLLKECLINGLGTTTVRRVSNFHFYESSDPEILNLELNAQFTCDNLYSTIAALCKNHNIGFKITGLSGGSLLTEFRLFKGVDRSFSQTDRTPVVFEDRNGNIEASKIFESKISFKGVCVVGGEGEGSNRKYVYASLPPQYYTAIGGGLRYRETFADARDLTSEGLSSADYRAQLITRGKEHLSRNHLGSKLITIDVASASTPTFRTDYDLGDYVQIEDYWGDSYRGQVMEVTISQSAEGTTVIPKLDIAIE